MAYISFQPSDFFNTVLYTGNGTTQSITGAGFQPDWTWIKERSSTSGHEVYDSTRGATKLLSPNTTDAEGTNVNALTSFDSDGFSVGSGGAVNENGQTYVGWNWKADGGTTSSNSDGSITSTVQANTTAGFSIVTYSGNGSTGTVGHGLGAVPKLYIVKRRNDAGWSWYTYSVHKGAGYTLYLNSTSAGDVDTTVWQNTSPTSDVFYVGARDGVNGSGGNMVAYCFADVKGYSKFGSYTGNGNANGPFVYTGFRPAWLMIRNTIAGEDWLIWDVKRDAALAFGNPMTGRLKANDVNAEVNGNDIDFLSNGFKIRTDSTYGNGSGNTIIYMAFAEFPLVGSNGLAGTAR